jgi:hypothetical protein
VGGPQNWPGRRGEEKNFVQTGSRNYACYILIVKLKKREHFGDYVWLGDNIKMYLKEVI